MKKISTNHLYIAVLWMVIFSNVFVKNSIVSFVFILIEAGLLFKIYRLFLKTNKQKDTYENLLKLESKLQTMTEEKDIPISILTEIKRITGADFIVYRSITQTAYGMSGIGSIHPDKDYGEHGAILNYTITWGRPIFVEDFNDIGTLSFETADFSLVSNENLVSIYAVPLIYKQKVLGGILFGTRTKYSLTEDRKRMFSSITSMLSVYLENKNLCRHIENQATMNERQRISREIHDGLAQSIGFINIQLHRLKKMITNNELEKAILEIDAAKEAVQDSYVELREAIEQLRDINSFHHSLEEWIKEYTTNFQRTNRIKINADFCEMNKLTFTDEQKVQVTRVIQEIFNNIRKHSQAHNVWLSCHQIGHFMILAIKDDGVGFDPTMNHKRKYHGNGLVILKERINSIDGDLHIHSSLHKGTKIEIQIPITN
jgi:nitrate/nitrite-specific signal transduction histidine kinase